MTTSPITTDTTLSSSTDNQEDAISLTLPSPPASPKTKRPFNEIEDPDAMSDEAPTSSTTTSTTPPPQKIRRQLQLPKGVQAVQLLRQERDYQRALLSLSQAEASAAPAPSVATPQPAMGRSGTRVRTNMLQPKDRQDFNQLYEAMYYEEENYQNMLYEAYIGTPAADLMFEFTKRSQDAAMDSASRDAQNQDPVDRANRPRIQFSEVVQVCGYDGEEAPERSLGITVEISVVEMGREDRPKYHRRYRPRFLLGEGLLDEM
ncbi:hypothetical protein BG003_000431 [Podila horticola]|nr:hypothetical protein BG003_000431 [Podila horticola]